MLALQVVVLSNDIHVVVLGEMRNLSLTLLKYHCSRLPVEYEEISRLGDWEDVRLLENRIV